MVEMNILHINSNYDQSSIYPNMARYMIRHCNLKGKVYFPVSDSKKVETLKAEFLDISNCLNSFDRYFYFYRNRKLFSDVKSRYNLNDFSHVLAYSLFSNGYLAYTIKKKYSIPYIVIVQNTDVNLYFEKVFFLRDVGRKILRNADKVIFISQPYKELVLNKFLGLRDKINIQRKSFVIPFGIDDFWFNNLMMNERKQLNIEEIKLLFVGKVNRNKNITTVIKACKKLLELGVKTTFTIVGNIETLELGNSLKTYNFISYIPFADKETLKNIYRNHDIFIMTSIKETFGLVYAEAMSQGLPVIYTRGQGFDKHFEEGKIGYSVDCFDVDEIVEKILLIRKNYFEMSRACVENVKKFNWNNIILQYKNILEDVV